MFSDTIRVHRLDAFAPTIDGNITPGEWSASTMYDISDIAGRGGTPQPAGSNIAYYLYDFAEGFMYFAMDCPYRTTRVDYDQFAPYMDEDKSGKWSPDSSEGNHWVEYVAPNDEVLYRALLDTVPNVWEMGVAPGAVSASSLVSGHLQFETKIPIGPDRWQYSINPGDAVGYFQCTALDNSALFAGWWPQTLTMGNWANPRFYGPMVFDSILEGVGGRNQGRPGHAGRADGRLEPHGQPRQARRRRNLLLPSGRGWRGGFGQGDCIEVGGPGICRRTGLGAGSAVGRRRDSARPAGLGRTDFVLDMPEAEARLMR